MRKIILAATAASALVAAAAVAQTAPGASNASPATGPAAPAAGGPAADSAPAPVNPVSNHAVTAADFVQLPSSDMLSSNVVGLDVYDGQHNNVGKIKDVAFDTSKKVSAYVIAVGGFLGMGERYVAVNPDAVAIAYDAGNKTWRAAMNASKDQLKAAPEFKYTGQWNGSRS